MPLSKRDKIGIHREMVLMRKFEEKAQEMYEASKIGGFLHLYLYIGQEAVAGGFMWAIEPQDYVIGAYREHGQAIARCADPRRVMAELFGKIDGVSCGKGGSMHLFDAPTGQADIKRAGSDITIIAYLRMVNLAIKAAENLAKEGISAEVLDLRTLRPMDVPTIINSVKKTHRVVVVEEDWPFFGIGAQVVDFIQLYAFDYLDAPILRVALEDVPMPYSRELELSALPDEHKIISAVRRLLGHV